MMYPTLQGGANDKSLLEEQTEILKRFPVGVTERQRSDYQWSRYNRPKGTQFRDPNWRPLREDDCTQKLADNESYFRAACKSGGTYYWIARP